MWSIAKGKYTGNGLKDPPSNKLFVDGKKATRPLKDADGNPIIYNKKVLEFRPTWYELIERRDEEEDVLQKLYPELKKIEEENLPHILFFERVLKYDHRGLFKLNASEGFVEKNARRRIIQLDIDLELEDSRINTKTIRRRLVEARRRLPFLNGLRMVAHLSNKAFLSTYPDVFALRIYLELSRAETLNDIKDTLKPFEHTIDLNMFSSASIHLVQPPEIVGSVERNIEGESIVYVDGKTLDLWDLRKGEEYLKEKANTDRYETVLYGMKEFSANSASVNEGLSELLELARSGWLDNKRYNSLYRIIQRADWVSGGAETIAKEICKHPEILGNHTETWIHGMVDVVKRRHHDYFNFELNQQDFDKVFEDPKQEDLKNYNLSALTAEVSDIFTSQKRFGLIIKSPYGSSKTSTVIPELMKVIEAKKGSKPRILYISTLKSIIRKVSKDIGIQCYVSEGDVIDKEWIIKQDDIGIGLRSLHILHAGSPFDLVIIDESEQVGFWAHTFSPNGNANHNVLIDLMASAKYGFVQMDADAAEMTWSMHDRAWKQKEFKKLLLENSMSWIKADAQKLIWTEGHNHLIEIACNHIAEDRFHFLHTDMADSKADQRLSALAKAVNDEFGEEKVIAFDDSSDRELKYKLTTYPDIFIPRLYEQGYRGIWVSPIIVSGWRYLGDPHFDATFGLYKNNFMSAPTILQRMQRVPYVSEHYISHANATGWTEQIKIREEVLAEIAQICEAGGDASFEKWNREQDRWELKAEAQSIHTKHLSNVNMHLKLMWAELGGHTSYLSALEEDRENWTRVARFFRDNQKELKEENARRVYEDPEENKRLANRFYDAEGNSLEELTSVDQTIEILELAQNDELHWEQAREILFLLTHSEEEWREHLILGWENEPIKIGKFTYKPKAEEFTSGLKPIGDMIKSLLSQIDLDGTENILDLLDKKKEIIIDMKEVDDKEYIRLRNQYKNAMKDWFYSVRADASATSFLSHICRNILQFEVDIYGQQTNEAVKAKKDLVQYYEEAKMMPDGLKDRKAYTVSRNIITKRIIDQIELSDIEEEYMMRTGGLIKIKRPKYYQKMRYNFVKDHIRDLRRKIYDEFDVL